MVKIIIVYATILGYVLIFVLTDSLGISIITAIGVFVTAFFQYKSNSKISALTSEITVLRSEAVILNKQNVDLKTQNEAFQKSLDGFSKQVTAVATEIDGKMSEQKVLIKALGKAEQKIESDAEHKVEIKEITQIAEDKAVTVAEETKVLIKEAEEKEPPIQNTP